MLVCDWFVSPLTLQKGCEGNSVDTKEINCYHISGRELRGHL